MAENEGSIRTTISICARLKSRMKRVKEPVNWSKIACRAFEDKLAEIAAKKEKKTMSDVVERLRASSRSHQGETFMDGYETGNRWGETLASFAELKRLANFQDSRRAQSRDAWELWFSPHGDHLPWITLVGVIQDDKNPHPVTTAQPFWRSVFGEHSSKAGEGAFLRGFVEGAVDLWLRVEKKL